LILVGQRPQEADQIVDLLLGHVRRAARRTAVERKLRVDVLAMRRRNVVELLHGATDEFGGLSRLRLVIGCSDQSRSMTFRIDTWSA
jgi:hypothetical protein